MTQLEILQWFSQQQHPYLTKLAGFLTFLGNEEFYFIVLPLIYWCISKKIGFRLFYMFIISMYVNAFLKISFAVMRPIGSEGIISLFVGSAEVGSHYPYDSFPSGHAQGATTLWGYMAYRSKAILFMFSASILILLISISRLYSGLHWPSDILAGIVIGVVIIAIAVTFEEFLASLSTKAHWLLAIVMPLLLLVLLKEGEGYKFSGILLGAGVGYLLENKFVKMQISSNFTWKLLAFLIGIAGMFALQKGLKLAFPEQGIFDFIRYSLIGVWGLYVAPLLFVSLKIYNRERQI